MCFGLLMSGPLRFLVAGMAGEGPGRRELAEFVTHHVLRHQHGQKLATVVDAEGQPNELRQNGRAARPNPDDLVATRGARSIRLVEEIAINERTLPDGTRHAHLPLLRRRMIKPSVRLLPRVL